MEIGRKVGKVGGNPFRWRAQTERGRTLLNGATLECSTQGVSVASRRPHFLFLPNIVYPSLRFRLLNCHFSLMEALPVALWMKRMRPAVVIFPMVHPIYFGSFRFAL